MFFDRIEAAPADPILGLTDAYKKDPNKDKVNLGVGVYQNNEGKTVPQNHRALWPGYHPRGNGVYGKRDPQPAQGDPCAGCAREGFA